MAKGEAFTYKFVEIEWIDATSECTWCNKDDLPNVSEIVTRGWLVRETKKCYTIAASVGHIDPKKNEKVQHDYGDIITIPRGCITKMNELRMVVTKKGVKLYG